MTTRQERGAYLQEQHEEALDETARECGYESVYDQARSEYANQYPGFQAKCKSLEEIRAALDEKARKIVAAAVEERDSITRVIAMNSF